MKRLWWFWFFLLIVAAGILGYGASLSGGFLTWDDPGYVLDAPLVNHLSWDTVAQSFTSVHYTDYAPLNTIALALQYAAWGPWAPGFRLVNLALHMLNAMLFFLIAVRLVGSRPLAAAGAILFLVHPLQAEPVAWVSEHKLLLCSAFFLGAILAHLRGGPRWLVLLLAVAAMFSKAAAVVLPLIFIADDILFRGRRWRAVFDELPLLLAAAGIAVLNVLAQHALGAVVLPHGGLAAHALGVLSLPGRYLLKLVVPVGLCPLYQIPVEEIFSWTNAVFIVGTAAIATLFVVAVRRGWNLVAFGIFWWWAAWLTVANLIPFPNWMADRYMYLPMGGAILALLAPLRQFAGRRLAAAIAALVAVAVLVAMAAHRQACLRMTNVGFWEATAACAPNVFAETNLAMAYLVAGRLDAAAAAVERALAKDPDCAVCVGVRDAVEMRRGRPPMPAR